MSVADVMSRIETLRGHLGMQRASGTSTAMSGAQFASALSAATGATTARSGATGADVVSAAKKYLGTPYVWGSNDPAKGLDCSGLVQRTFADLGIDLPRVSKDQAKVGTAVPNLAAAKPGDLLAFNSPVDHIGIYAGDGMMIAAPRAGQDVKLQKVYETPSAIRRVVPDASTSYNVATASAVVRPAALTATTAVPAASGQVSGVPYADLFNAAGAKYGVSPKLLAAVAKVESGYNPRAVSKAGAQGVMQLMPSTAKGLGVSNSFDPAQAIDGGAKLLARNLKDFKSLDLALAAYNAGGGAVRKYGGIPPYSETQAYVPKVKAALNALGGGS